MIYEVMVQGTGMVYIKSTSADAAIKAAAMLTADDIAWDDDWRITGAFKRDKLESGRKIFDDEDVSIKKWKERMATTELTDKVLEEWWNMLEDVPMNPITECMEDEYMCWPAGTKREEIWRWFNKHHSKGVAYLLEGSSNRSW